MEFLVENSADGKIYDLSETVLNITYSTVMNNGAGKLTFDYIKQGIMFSNGSIISFKDSKDEGVFYGFMFNTTNSKGDIISAVAYDQLRYLKYKDSLMLKNFTAGKLLKFLCDKRKLKWGMVEDTKHTLEDKISRNKTDLDVIYEASSETLIATSKMYIMYDNFGKVNYQEANNLKLPLILGDNSLAYGYSYQRSIDGETYNRIKIAQKKKDKEGNTYLDQTFVTDDPETQRKWGILQYYEEVDEGITQARIMQRGKDLLRLYNREERSLSLACIGDSRVIAGKSIKVQLANLQIDAWFIVSKATHNYEGSKHTMEIEVRMV